MKKGIIILIILLELFQCMPVNAKTNYNLQYEEIQTQQYVQSNISSSNYNISINEVLSGFEIWDAQLNFDNISNRKGKIKYIVVHHTGSENTSIYDIHQWHTNNGWGGIGYNFYIRKDGKIYKGRDINKKGAHCIGRNNDSIGIALEGNFEITEPTNEQIVSLLRLSLMLLDYYGVDNINLHKDFNSTDCPGKNFPYEMYKQLFYDCKKLKY